MSFLRRPLPGRGHVHKRIPSVPVYWGFSDEATLTTTDGLNSAIREQAGSYLFGGAGLDRYLYFVFNTEHPDAFIFNSFEVLFVAQTIDVRFVYRSPYPQNGTDILVIVP